MCSQTIHSGLIELGKSECLAHTLKKFKNMNYKNVYREIFVIGGLRAGV